MGSPIIDVDVCPNPRTKEENQERAFIAASRRKDRSLDARVESANRASSLHKQRTGKALLISRDIVEREAMYEEVDDRYQEKINRMLHAQSMQLQSEFNRNLMAAFAVNRPGALHQRRATSSHLNPRASLNGIRKMSLDLSGLRASVSEGMHTGPMTSPLGTHQSSYVLSPTYDGSSQSPSYPSVVPATSGQLPSYLTQTAGGPTWPAQLGGPQPMRSPWTAGFTSPPQQVPTTMGEMGSMPVRQFRDRLGSAPVIPVHTMPSPSLATPTAPGNGATVPPTTASRTAHPMYQHTRVRSEPSQAMRSQSLAHLSQHNSPHGLPMESEPIPTPDLCPTPSTPHSPTSTGQNPGLWGLELHKDEGMGYGQEHHLDPDFEDFSRFAFGLGSGSQLPESETAFDEFFTMEDFPVSA
ncbi:hypothetical protein ASPCADRAFT_212323 [Aspergillus carbonarius ITEM 5010]|uniref:Uncharacterized protein n=1 Tax=Aspergillus carbonarius (strain ITEM 5010) TaxID=602072 RepID=A0A1R3R669_ASPC5|nr:hypothetical protein ASPCADRAFT_212323 [Aspergillus carbonarius ITEM 5010]